MNTEQWCADDALMMRWWCADDALMMHWWCTDDIQMIHGWFTESSFQKYTTCRVFLALCNMLFLSICVFVYLYFCICAFGTWEYNFWYPWTILFSKIYHMLGLSGTLSYAVFVYLCICIFVFVRSAHGNKVFDILEQSSLQKYTTCLVFLALCHMLYLCICVFVFVYLCMRHLVISILISLNQELSENLWFVWSKTS